MIRMTSNFTNGTFAVFVIIRYIRFTIKFLTMNGNRVIFP